MSNALLAQHVALIRDYLAPPVPTPAPPAPAPAPSPRPPLVPPVFAVQAVSPIDLTIATLISPARGLATISTTFKWAGGVAPVLSTAAASKDYLSAQYFSDDDILIGSLMKAFA